MSLSKLAVEELGFGELQTRCYGGLGRVRVVALS
jgi:hypothetical protein